MESCAAPPGGTSPVFPTRYLWKVFRCFCGKRYKKILRRKRNADPRRGSVTAYLPIKLLRVSSGMKPPLKLEAEALGPAELSLPQASSSPPPGPGEASAPRTLLRKPQGKDKQEGREHQEPTRAEFRSPVRRAVSGTGPVEERRNGRMPQLAFNQQLKRTRLFLLFVQGSTRRSVYYNGGCKGERSARLRGFRSRASGA